ncbi:MAG: M20 family metallopeptidase [Acidimicrobiia bacterium]|nr:MAG: M20 family metallopeptidase [Acidimicrobiia bacterium]
MDTKALARTALEANEIGLHELSQWMYENPEIGYEEHETSARMAEVLRSGGFDVEYPAYGLETAFVARTGKSGPEVIICAEMDALPEVGQACGHNIIGAAAIGAGLAIAKLADELGIRVTILGTPAEEHLGGKVDLINAGAFKDASAAMMIHPSVEDLVDPQFLAITHIEVDFYGKASHAASQPELGINALDAAVQAYVNVSTLRQQLLDSDRVHGIITYGGGAPNVIPAHTSMVWNVRSATEERLDELYPKVEACFKAAAIATGCTYEVRESGNRYQDMRSDLVLCELYEENSDRLGRPMHRLADLPPMSSGSTDMANVSYEVPTIHPMLDLRCYPIVNHQPEFAAHTITADGKAIIRDGALAMAWTIIDLAEGNRWDDLGTF